jgi:hypothetical protein
MKTNLLTSEKWQKQTRALWPAAKGSLNLVHKPCIRPRCRACARGDKHPAWMLTFTQAGRRKVMYVPLGLVSQLRQAIANGRQIEKLLAGTGPELIKQYRQSVKTSAKPQSKS